MLSPFSSWIAVSLRRLSSSTINQPCMTYQNYSRDAPSLPNPRDPFPSIIQNALQSAAMINYWQTNDNINNRRTCVNKLEKIFHSISVHRWLLQLTRNHVIFRSTVISFSDCRPRVWVKAANSAQRHDVGIGGNVSKVRRTWLERFVPPNRIIEWNSFNLVISDYIHLENSNGTRSLTPTKPPLEKRSWHEFHRHLNLTLN